MKTYKSKYHLNKFTTLEKKLGKTIGFIPTMGALHQGHISLIEAAKNSCDIVVCSVFVNPTQFNNPSDLEKYPRNTVEDAEMLAEAGCDVLFLPSVQTIYPKGTKNYTPPKLGKILEVLEGEFRPGHFKGMMQVVEILLRIVAPNEIYMGLKDYQQYQIVAQMVKAVDIDVEVIGMPIVREKNGLAMSSRNRRLTAKGKQKALALSKAIKAVKQNLTNKTNTELESIGKSIINKVDSAEIEYFSIVDKNSLLPVKDNSKQNLIVLTATWIDGIRLLDNQILS